MKKKLKVKQLFTFNDWGGHKYSTLKIGWIAEMIILASLVKKK